MLLFRFWIVVCILIGVSHVSQSMVLWCFYTIDDYAVASRDNVTLLPAKYLDVSKTCTIFYAFGYSGVVDDNILFIIASLLLLNCSVCLVNWQKESNTGLPPIPQQFGIRGWILNYPGAVQLTEEVGETLGHMLIDLTRNRFPNLDPQTVTLMGHSLGGHVMQPAACMVKNDGQMINRIIGLDVPDATFAGPDFQALNSSCATKVYAILSDWNGYGGNTTYAHLNIYLNYQYYTNHNNNQPGCSSLTIPFSDKDFCSHVFSWKFIIDTIYNVGKSIAAVADSVSAYLAGQITQKVTVQVLMDTTATGIGFICTNSKSPYGMGDDGADPQKCLK